MSDNYIYPMWPPTKLNVQLSDPAAGANLSSKTASLQRSLVIGIQFRLVTDANVPPRTPIISFGLSGGYQQGTVAVVNQGGSTTRDYFCGAGVGQSYLVPSIDLAQISLPVNITLEANDFINIIINDIQAGDQISNVELQILPWARTLA